MTTRRIYAAAAVRSFTTGLTGVLLGLYLAEAGFRAGDVGLVVGAGLGGMALATAFVTFYGDALGRRTVLLAVSALSAAGLLAVASAGTLNGALLAGAAFIGMINGMGRDRGAAQTLDQSILADGTPAAHRTAVFTRYTLIQDVAGAIGSLAAGLPAVLGRSGFAVLSAYRWTLVAAAIASLIPVVLYAGLAVEAGSRGGPIGRPRVPLSPDSRRRVRGLAGLFALDSLGGGLLAGSIVTYWFFRRFGLGGDVLGPVFFAARGLNALSYLGAEALSRRVGLVRTMVFTHLPSSVVLIALPFVPSAPLVIALFLAREALVQMDVPTRQSYVAAVTQPGERTYALGVTGMVRNVGWAGGPALAGWTMGAFGLGAPLVLGAALKIVYDLALYASYRHVRAPEEARGES